MRLTLPPDYLSVWEPPILLHCSETILRESELLAREPLEDFWLQIKPSAFDTGKTLYTGLITTDFTLDYWTDPSIRDTRVCFSSASCVALPGEVDEDARKDLGSRYSCDTFLFRMELGERFRKKAGLELLYVTLGLDQSTPEDLSFSSSDRKRFEKSRPLKINGKP